MVEVQLTSNQNFFTFLCLCNCDVGKKSRGTNGLIATGIYECAKKEIKYTKNHVKTIFCFLYNTSTHSSRHKSTHHICIL